MASYHDAMENYKLPLGEYIELFFDWLVDVAAGFFDAMSVSLEWLITSSTDVLLWLPPALFIVFLGGFALWLHRSWSLLVFVVISMLLIWNLGYWQEMMQTLSLVLYATLLCVLLGLPLGIYAAHHPWM